MIEVKSEFTIVENANVNETSNIHCCVFLVLLTFKCLFVSTVLDSHGFEHNLRNRTGILLERN